MSETPPRVGRSWIAFFGGVVAMLAVVLAWSAWRSRDVASEVLRDAASAVAAVPELTRPTLPDAPRLPDPPIPTPK